jgi:hypothetical protein
VAGFLCCFQAYQQEQQEQQRQQQQWVGATTNKHSLTRNILPTFPTETFPLLPQPMGFQQEQQQQQQWAQQQQQSFPKQQVFWPRCSLERAPCVLHIFGADVTSFIQFRSNLQRILISRFHLSSSISLYVSFDRVVRHVSTSSYVFCFCLSVATFSESLSAASTSAASACTISLTG